MVTAERRSDFVVDIAIAVVATVAAVWATTRRWSRSPMSGRFGRWSSGFASPGCRSS